MEWKDNVPTPGDIIDVGKKKLGDFGRFLPWVILGLFGRPSLGHYFLSKH